VVRLEAARAVVMPDGEMSMIDFRSVTGSLALATLLALPTPQAAARSYSDSAKTIAGWDLASNSKTCRMASTFADNVTIALIWAPSIGELGFMAAVPKPDELSSQKAAPLLLSFDGAGPYKQWEDRGAAVVEGQDSVGLVGNWGKDHADDLARTIAAASHVRVRIGDREIGSYDLGGNRAAYKALRRCGDQLAAK
jgi:hypothetical protein